MMPNNNLVFAMTDLLLVVCFVVGAVGFLMCIGLVGGYIKTSTKLGSRWADVEILLLGSLLARDVGGVVIILFFAAWFADILVVDSFPWHLLQIMGLVWLQAVPWVTYFTLSKWREIAGGKPGSSAATLGTTARNSATDHEATDDTLRIVTIEPLHIVIEDQKESDNGSPDTEQLH